jgi:hypothetical protein
VGTEFGFFMSADEGQESHRFMNGLPVVRVDDVLVHPRENDLVLATHGRSIYVMDDITSLQATTEATMAMDVHLYEPRESVRWRNNRLQSRSVTGDKNWQGENAPTGTEIDYWLREAATGDVRITITDALTGQVFRTMEGTGLAGLNRVQWNQRGDTPPGGGGRGRRGGGRGGRQGPQAQPGVYNVTLSVGGEEYATSVRVLEDVWDELTLAGIAVGAVIRARQLVCVDSRSATIRSPCSRPFSMKILLALWPAAITPAM